MLKFKKNFLINMIFSTLELQKNAKRDSSDLIN